MGNIAGQNLGRALMFNGAHTIIYSTDAVADREFFRSVLGLDHVDAGGGWLIFALPPGEVAFHPHEAERAHELYLMCEDIGATRAQLLQAGVACREPVDEGWGLLSSFDLPGGSSIGFYQPRHDRP